LYLERLLTPLVFELGRARSLAPPAGRRVPLRTKVFACSLVLLVMTVLLFGTVFWNQSARLLEREAGKGLLAIARHAAEHVERGEVPSFGRGELGTSGRAYVVDADGTVQAGDAGTVRRLDELDFRPEVLRTVLDGPAGHLVDRTGIARIV